MVPLLQTPEEITLGSRHQLAGRGRKRKATLKKDTFTYVPILKTVDSILSDKQNIKEVDHMSRYS